MANNFNTFFSSFEFEKDVSTADCKLFTFNNFRSNLSDLIKLVRYSLNFKNKSSAGCSGLPVTYFKSLL